jgi:hypothetical protein
VAGCEGCGVGEERKGETLGLFEAEGVADGEMENAGLAEPLAVTVAETVALKGLGVPRFTVSVGEVDVRGDREPLCERGGEVLPMGDGEDPPDSKAL